MTVGFRATGSSTAAERISVLPQVSSPYAQDLELAQRASKHEMRAQKQLAQRLTVRVRRAAHAIMGGSCDAHDAAQHALIEILRASDGYSGDTSLEEWADRLTAHSVVRFSRAIRARSGQSDTTESPTERPELAARTLEELLRRLPSVPREALLLREVFGFDIPEIAQLIRASRRSVREYLARAREGLYARSGSSKQPGALVFALPDELERWFTLRDREGSTAQEQASEVEQLALESKPEVRLMMKELRGLAQFLDGGRFGRLSGPDRKLVDAVLTAVKVSSRAGGHGAVLVDVDQDISVDHAGLSWVQPFSMGMCGLLVVSAFVSLAYYVLGARRAGVSAAEPRAAVTHAPTVEALSVARAAQGSSSLERSGNKLVEGSSVYEADVIAAHGRPGCFVLEPKADVCLGTGAEARIAQLGLDTRRIELLSGRAVISIQHGEPALFAVSVGELRADASDAVIGVEIDGGTVIVRALRGSVHVQANGKEQQLGSAQSAIYRVHEQDLEVVPQPIEKARRDWDLLATRTRGPIRAAVPQASRTELQAGVEAPAQPVSTEVDGAVAIEAVDQIAPPVDPEPVLDSTELLAQARTLARAQRWSEAEQAYERLVREFPVDTGSREALVALGELQLQQLARPDRALATFDRYLASGGGALDLRARYGHILALRRLEHVADEQAALAQFLNLYGATPQARVLLSGADGEAQRAEADSKP